MTEVLVMKMDSVVPTLFLRLVFYCFSGIVKKQL